MLCALSHLAAAMKDSVAEASVFRVQENSEDFLCTQDSISFDYICMHLITIYMILNNL